MDSKVIRKLILKNNYVELSNNTNGNQLACMSEKINMAFWSKN